jgi:hypothetical protein
MDLTKILVVSNYNTDLEWTKMTYDYGFSPKNTVIYDRSDEEKDWSHLGTSIRSPNVGENIYDMMRFILENYDCLPDISIFVKGNLFSRSEENGGENYYTTRERFIRSLQANYFLPIERYHPTTSFNINGGGYIEPSWYHHHSSSKYFSTYSQLMQLLFENPINPDYIRFAPGGNYVVPKENILKYSSKLYEKLMLYCSHCEVVCAEAYLIERALYAIWTEDFIEKQ